MIKVGFCISYDWYLLKYSLPAVYEHADKICLAIDKQRRAWSGEKFTIDEIAFRQFLAESDPDHKIILMEEDLVDITLDARQNCNRHRHLIADTLGKGGWHVQIDTDEYFVDFKAFVDVLRKINPNPSSEEKPMNVCCPFYVIYKKVQGGFLMVDYGDTLPEMIPMATTRPQYERARQNSFYNYYATTPVLHQSWARDEQELWFKINNWGHSSEELEMQQKRVSYFNLWKSMDKFNYLYIHDIHPVKPDVWPRLQFYPEQEEAALVGSFGDKVRDISPWILQSQNNRMLARILFYGRKMLQK
jgi:hypothetical protein